MVWDRAAGLWQRSVLSGTGDQHGGACVAGSVLLGSDRPLLEMVLKITGSRERGTIQTIRLELMGFVPLIGLCFSLNILCQPKSLVRSEL